MTEFLDLVRADEARAALAAFPPVGAERVPVAEADGRVLAEDVTAPEPLPGFARSTMDGYAVRSRDLVGASASAPAFLRVIGAVPMGGRLDRPVGPGEAAAVGTGGALPEGADAVVMLEYVEPTAAGEVAAQRAVAPGENAIRPGEDVALGERVAVAGRRLRPQDVGLLAALGVVEVTARRRPRVGLLSTGDELVAPGERPEGGRVRDANSWMVAAQARRAGAEVVAGGIVADDEAALRARLAELLARCDAVFLSGGSSVGVRDVAARAIETLGAPGVLFHGISVRPGRPTLAARVGDRPVVGLPGHPTSAAVIFDVFFRPLLYRLGGEPDREPWPFRARGRLTRPVPSPPGREDWVRVRLARDPSGATLVDPVRGGSAALASLTRADGLVRVAEGAEGLAAGAEVEVRLYEEPSCPVDPS